MTKYRVIATQNKEEFVEFTPIRTIESAKRIIEQNGYKHNVIVNEKDEVIERIEL